MSLRLCEHVIYTFITYINIYLLFVLSHIFPHIIIIVVLEGDYIDQHLLYWSIIVIHIYSKCY